MLLNQNTVAPPQPPLIQELPRPSQTSLQETGLSSPKTHSLQLGAHSPSAQPPWSATTEQTFAHSPQLLLSELGSTQTPSQSSSPGPHAEVSVASDSLVDSLVDSPLVESLVESESVLSSVVEPVPEESVSVGLAQRFSEQTRPSKHRPLLQEQSSSPGVHSLVSLEGQAASSSSSARNGDRFFPAMVDQRLTTRGFEPQLQREQSS